MDREHEAAAEAEQASRMVRQLDNRSQDVLNRYLRDVEYDLVYRTADRDRAISI